MKQSKVGMTALHLSIFANVSFLLLILIQYLIQKEAFWFAWGWILFCLACIAGFSVLLSLYALVQENVKKQPAWLSYF